MNAVILGGGLAGLSLAYFLKRRSVIIERAEEIGGLSRSFQFNGIWYDLGPHIIFSKNAEILKLHTSLIDAEKIRRSNKIYFNGKLIKYPFENDLGSLDEQSRDYCVREFVNNPYERYQPRTMLQFFLHTFGEGITRLYLQPYNEKIWKFDPSCMDTQMVDRIPKPPKEDVLKSAQNIVTEGYTHQLYFHYPRQNGFQELPKAYAAKIRDKSEILTGTETKRIEKKGSGFRVVTDQGTFETNTLVNCIPLHELFKLMPAPPEAVQTALDNLMWLSLHVVVVQVAKDRIGDNFTLTLPDRDVVFHRLNKLDFLGPAYHLPSGGSTLQAEVSFRKGTELADASPESIRERVIDGLVKCNFIDRKDVLAVTSKRVEYAYPIYDLNHRQNADRVLAYLRDLGIRCCGRFAEFEYMNTDKVAEHSQRLARELEE